MFGLAGRAKAAGAALGLCRLGEAGGWQGELPGRHGMGAKNQEGAQHSGIFSVFRRGLGSIKARTMAWRWLVR